MSVCYRNHVFRDHAQKIYVGYKKIESIYVGEKICYPSVYVPTRYAMWTQIEAQRCSGSSDLPIVDQLGNMLYFNTEPKIKKSAVYIEIDYAKRTSPHVETPEGGTLCDAINWGIRGSEIDKIIMAAFGGYRGGYVFGKGTQSINEFTPRLNRYGFYETGLVLFNIFGADGERIAYFDSGVQTKNTRVFYSKDEFISYLSSD
nr:MAG TPA: hypothetical protein [Caudoviricetes sp.]